MELVQTKLKATEISKKDVNIIIFAFNNENIMWGLSQTQWLMKASEKYNYKVVRVNENFNEQSMILQNLTSSKITIVFYSFTPLIQNSNIDFYVDYLTFKSLDLVKFPYGYIFKTDYIKNNKSFKEPILFEGVNGEFAKLENQESLNYIKAILKNRILNKLIQNGVEIFEPNSTLIDEEVVIESGTQIYPFNVIKGKSFIKKNCVLKEGNTIEDTKLGNNVVVGKSVISNSVIDDNTIIYPFNTIVNCEIAKDCLVKSYNSLKNIKTKKEEIIDKFKN